MQKANYDEIADYFDRTRLFSDEGTRAWLERIARTSRAEAGARVLDLGCGTGRFAIPMARELGFRVTGADASDGMLAKARAKDTDGLVQWDKQDAGALTYADGTFDVVYISRVLHHVDSPERVLAECFRVLRAPGALLVRWGSWEQTEGDVVHRFFPEIVELERPRIPVLAGLEGWLRDAGFSEVASEEFVQRTCETAAVRVRSIEEKGASGLTLISDEAYQRGLAALRQYAAEHPGDPWLLTDCVMLTSGYKV